ncbi:E3 ubiquitin-protein ligase rad18 [Recurvomyces mirabilis]|nr:E3 ubiquitin-protein ligase rad18 [Recurvomyces mirabilis]
MEISGDIPDSTDWLNTPLRDFAQLENALHCQICKEFYNCPMLTSCSHSFCSKCIRSSLSADGRCPACRTVDQASKLRNNWALEEVVATFLAARPRAISVARREQEQAQYSSRPGKRKRVVLDSEEVEESSRTTRSKSRKMAASQTSNPDVVEVDDSEGDDGAYEPEAVPDDGLVECPLGCGKRMKVEQVEPHLDRCDEEKEQEQKAKSRKSATLANRTIDRQSPRPQDRLAELNYSLLKEQPMRKKLEELGIPGWGSKQLMVRRHTEWVNLWNANCDSNQPRTKRELLHDLDSWERTQGGKAPTASNMSTNVMRKDFDGGGWANKNKDEFSRLIADARRKKSNPESTPDQSKVDTSDEFAKPALDGDEDNSPHFDSAAANPPTSQKHSSSPYADNPDAMASIREKVEAANAGRHIEPLMNQGFENTALNATKHHTSSKPVAHAHAHAHASTLSPATPSVPGTENEAMMSEGFRQIREASNDEHTVNQRTGSPCVLPAHMHNSTRQVPMFELPSEPVNDIDGAGEGTHV